MKKFIALALVIVSVFALASTALAAYSTMYINCPVGETVRLRSSPSTSGTVLINIPRGTAVQAESYNSTWHRVSYNGYNGYMMSSFLSSSRPAGQDTPWLLRYGTKLLSTSSGDNSYIRVLQQDLMSLGYDLSPYYADGYYGIKTKEAVMDFQRYAGLSADGICGDKTKEALYNEIF